LNAHRYINCNKVAASFILTIQGTDINSVLHIGTKRSTPLLILVYLLWEWSWRWW